MFDTEWFFLGNKHNFIFSCFHDDCSTVTTNYYKTTIRRTTNSNTSSVLVVRELLLYLCYRLDLCRTNSFPASDDRYRDRVDRVTLRLSRAAAASAEVDPKRDINAVWGSPIYDLEANIAQQQPLHVANGPLYPILRPVVTTGTRYGEQGYCFVHGNGGSMGRERNFKQITLTP